MDHLKAVELLDGNPQVSSASFPRLEEQFVSRVNTLSQGLTENNYSFLFGGSLAGLRDPPAQFNLLS